MKQSASEWTEIDGVEVARRVLEAIVANGKLHPAPDVQAFGAAVREMVSQYHLIHTAERMPAIKAVQDTFVELQTAALRFRNSYGQRLSRNWIAFFLLTSLNSSDNDVDLQTIDQDLQSLLTSTEKLLSYLDTGIAYCVAEYQAGTNMRFLELADVAAVTWLYGHAIPNLYEQFMGVEYKIDGREVETPEECFAKALLENSGLPATSLSNLRSHDERQRAARTAAHEAASGVTSEKN